MQQARRTLSVKSVPHEAPPTADGVDDVQALLCTLIKRRRCVSFVYNKVAMKVAPHIVYTKHDDPFVDAVVLERDGKPPKEAKLGAFKLAGLSAVTGTTTPFSLWGQFTTDDARYADQTICAIG